MITTKNTNRTICNNDEYKTEKRRVLQSPYDILGHQRQGRDSRPPTRLLLGQSRQKLGKQVP